MSEKQEYKFIASYYQGYYGITNRSWRRLGLRFMDVDKGVLDDSHVIKVFEECSGDPVPSRLAALYLLWAQVRVFSTFVSLRKDMLLTKFTFGIHAEVLYDRLTDRMLTKHKDVLTPGGKLSPKFSKAPIPWMLNIVKRTIKDSIYDMYRFEHDKKAGRPVRLRSPARKVLMDRNTTKMENFSVCELSDAQGYSQENSPWAEMERLNTGVPLWEN